MKKFNLNSIFILGLIVLNSCSSEPKKIDMDVQGHRGFRGMYPENTINGFLKALDAGVNTLEMDVVISKDQQVVVSHEPFFNHEISTSPTGEEITKETELNYNLFRMTYEEISSFDVGLKPHPRFPEQEKISVAKPLLTEVIQKADAYAKSKGYDTPHYNIELKRKSDYDYMFHPDAETFSKLVLEVIYEMGVEQRVSLQAFDPSTLQMLKELNSEIPLVLLVENDLSIDKNIENLGFKPEVYSPDFTKVDKAMVKYCEKHEMKLIPWTVNEEADIQKMIDLGVDGIISDYPNRVLKLVGR